MAQKLSMRENLERANLFFGEFPGDHKTFFSWKENFLCKQKRMKKEAQERLMKDVGGTGKYNATPPSEYCTPVEKFRFVSEDDQCEKCKENFTNETIKPIMVSASFIFPYQKENRFKGLASHAKLKPLSLLISLF